MQSYKHLLEAKDTLIDYRILETAHQVINKTHSIAESKNLWWDTPLVNFTEEQEIVLEWWNSKRKITIYVSDQAIDYIKVWDTDIETGSISLYDDFTPLWSWIS